MQDAACVHRSRPVKDAIGHLIDTDVGFEVARQELLIPALRQHCAAGIDDPHIADLAGSHRFSD